MATLQKHSTDSTQQAEQKFLEVLRSFDYAMLISGAAGEEPHARPMAIAETSPDGTLWFLTGKDTQKVFEIAENTRALAVMQGDSRYLSITGRARIVDDRAHIHALWKEPMRVWFDGKDDPNIVLICLEPAQRRVLEQQGPRGRAARAALREGLRDR
jgi:general stress protein 26